jgi:hypothetical protein
MGKSQDLIRVCTMRELSETLAMNFKRNPGVYNQKISLLSFFSGHRVCM